MTSDECSGTAQPSGGGADPSGGEQQQFAQQVASPDADRVGEPPTAEQAQQPTGLPEHVEPGKGSAPQPFGTRDCSRLRNVTFPVLVDRP